MALAARTAGPGGGLILFVVQPGEINSYDQQVCPLMLCFALQQLLNEVLLWHCRLSSFPAAVTRTASRVLAAFVLPTHFLCLTCLSKLSAVLPGALQWLQTALWERSKVRTLRRTLHQIHEQGSVDEASGQLTVDGHPVSVVYYRAGYSPDDYAGDAEWEARSAARY